MKLDPQYTIKATNVIKQIMYDNRLLLLDSFGSIEHTTKKDLTIVTEMDGLLEEKLTTGILSLDSEVGIVGEEFGTQGSKDVYWLLDPIDGTEQFVRGLVGCVNMACLIVDDEPVVSIIYDFIQDKMYVAEKNKGAQCNNAPIHVSNRPLERSWIEFAFRRDQPEVIPALSKLMQQCNVVRLRNSLLVSSGNIDGLVAVNGKGGLWDYAPRMLMISEAGGRVANIGSDTYDFKNTSFVASNPIIFEQLQIILTDAY